MKRKRFTECVTAFAVCGMLSCSVTAYATTVDDVANVARELGYSEAMIQQGYANYYAEPDKYTSEDFDRAIAKLYEEEDIIFSTGEQKPTEPTTTTTTTTTAGGTSAEEDSQSGEGESGGNTNGGQSGGITLETGDGSTFERIPSNEFIGMTYEEKNDYIRSFPPEQQQVILDNLSVEERRNMMKQLPIEQKMEVVDSMAEVGEALGINISVEEISDDNISLSMRNDNGEFVGMVNAGTLVEDTGYDRRGIFAVAGGFVAVALALLGVVFGCFRKNGEANER